MFSGVPKWFLAAQPSPGAAAVHNSGNTVSSGVDRVGENLWYLERKEDGSGWEPHSFLQTPFDEQGARFSPDGHYVAYVSNESGQNEVYVRPFPEGGRKVTVSSNGGRQPRWSRDGKELFYVEGQTLLAVSVSSDSSFAVGSATPLFELPGRGCPIVRGK